MEPASARDFFISYTGVNEVWATWIAVALEKAGYTTVLQAFDFRPGQDFVHSMQKAASESTRTVAVLSPAYFGSRFGESEWRAAFAKDPTGELGLLIPVRVQPCQPTGLLASRAYIDLLDLDEDTARQRLLEGVEFTGARPTTAVFPGPGTRTASVDERFPGSGPALSNLPARSRYFIGRGEDLERLHADLLAGASEGMVAVQAVHGLGGVGKTRLVLEYAHRFASDYDLIWWVPAEQATAAAGALAQLAGRMHAPEGLQQSEMVTALFDDLRRRRRWLLIYDNAERPEQLSPLLPPDGNGHVLVTSRWSAWGNNASRQRLATLPRGESIKFLARRTGQDDAASLDSLADLLGDLPLALEEAAAYLEETGDDLNNYLRLVRERGRELFGLTLPAYAEQEDRRRVATVWSVALDRVHTEAPAAEALLNLCAFLAPDVPRPLPTEQPQRLPQQLAGVVSDPLLYNRTLAVIGRYSLAEVSPAGIGLHRLVQLVLQSRLGAEEERIWVGAAVALLRDIFPNASWDSDNWQRCERLLPHVLAVTGHAERLGVSGEDAGWLMNRSSTYLRELGQYRQARPLAERAVTVTEEALGADHLEVAGRRDELGRVLRRLGNLRGARVQYERALTITETALGTEHRSVAIVRSNFGNVLRSLGDLDEARRQYERALEITETVLGPDHREAGTVRGNLGGVLQELGYLQEARTQLERALQITETALGPDHREVGTHHGDLGNVLENLGDLDGAREQYERALRITLAALGPDHPDMAARHSRLGGVLHALDDLRGAREQYERALQIAAAALGPDHSTRAGDLDALADVQERLGEMSAAETGRREAAHIREIARQTGGHVPSSADGKPTVTRAEDPASSTRA